MAPLPPNATDRLWVHYAGPAGQHEVMFRFPPGTDSAEAVLSARGVVQEMKIAVTTDTVFDGARWSEAGSLVSFPVPFTPVVGTNPEVMTGEEYPNFITWLGRDAAGRRVRWALNGVPLNADSDYRLQAGDDLGVAAVIAALGSASPAIVTINNMEPVVYNYADTGRNAYFQRKRRRTA